MTVRVYMKNAPNMPIEYAGVRMSTIYAQPGEDEEPPELVFYFDAELERPQVNIQLDQIHEIVTFQRGA